MMPIRDPDPNTLWNAYRKAAAREEKESVSRIERIMLERQFAQRVYNIREENERCDQRRGENK